MSRIFITASIDTSIYQSLPNNNTGLDEILEVGKIENTGSIYVSPVRSLIKFNLTGNITGSASASASAFLSLKTANVENATSSPVIYAHPISSSWLEGTGYFYQTPFNATDGATWLHRFSGSLWVETGSTHLETPAASTIFSTTDLRLDVSNIVLEMRNGVIPNNGFLLKLSDYDEGTTSIRTNFKFFSRNSHTIHVPILELAWINQQFVTGSLKPMNNTEVEIAPKNLKSTYKKGSKIKLYYNVRDLYPTKVFTATSQYTNKYYLPSGSIFGITDVAAGTSIVPMDIYSHINCDTTGSYINIDTSHFYKNRYYRIDIQIPFETYYIFAPPQTFKVT